MKKNQDKNTRHTQRDLQEHLTAIRVAAQLMCRQSEGRQTYPLAQSIVMLTEQALDKLKHNTER